MRIALNLSDLASAPSILSANEAISRLASKAVSSQEGLADRTTANRHAYNRGEADYLIPWCSLPERTGKVLKPALYQPPVGMTGATGLTAASCRSYFAINAEMDGGSLAEQFARVNDLPPALEPTLVCWSGNKSLHVAWALKELAGAEVARKLRRLVAHVLGGDMQVAESPVAGMRLPGWEDDERRQPVLFVSDAVYSCAELEDAARNVLAERGADLSTLDRREARGAVELVPSDDPMFAGLTVGGHRDCPWCGGRGCLSVFVSDDGQKAATCFNPKCGGEKGRRTRFAEPSITTAQVRGMKTSTRADVDALFADAPAGKDSLVTTPLEPLITRESFPGFKRVNPVDTATGSFAVFLAVQGGASQSWEPREIDTDTLDPLYPPSPEVAKELNEEAERRFAELLGKTSTCNRGLVFSGPGDKGSHAYFAAPCYQLDCDTCGKQASAALRAAFLAVAGSWALSGGAWEVGVYEATGCKHERRNLLRWEDKHKKELVDETGKRSGFAMYDLRTLTFMVRPGTSLTVCAWRSGVADPSPQLRKKMVVTPGQSPIDAARTIIARFDLEAWAAERKLPGGKKLRYFRGRPQDLTLLSALRRRLVGIKPPVPKPEDAPSSLWAPVWETPEATCAALNKEAARRGLDTTFLVSSGGRRRLIEAVGFPEFPVHDLVVEWGLERKVQRVSMGLDADDLLSESA